MSSQLISDLKTDCEKQVKAFLETDSTSFSTFVFIWKKNNFDMIYAGQGEADIDYFTFHILHIAKSFCDPSKNKLERVAGLYLLYLLYYTEPLKIKKPIRLTPSDFIYLKELADEFKDSNKEVPYAFYKLLLDNAFDFVITPLPYDENLFHHKEDLKAQSLGPVTIVNEQATVKSVIEETGFSLKELSKLVNEYNSSKLKINNSCSLHFSMTNNLGDS